MFRNRLILILLTCVIPTSSLVAQAVRQERRRDFIENLLRAVIESQVDSQDAREPGRIVIPGQPRVVPPRQIAVTPQMVNVRKYVQSWGGECDQLIQGLRGQSGRIPQVLPILGDLLQIRANINLLNRQCNAYPTIQPVRQHVVNLDRDWRVAKYRLGRINQLPNDCTQCINRCQNHHQQLCTAFNLEPQFQRRRLAALVNEMHADIKHLLQDIYYECQGNPELPTLLNRGRTLQAKIEQYAPLVQRGSYEQVVAAFKDSRNVWREFSHRVWQLSSERIRHDLSHIEELGQQAAELLMIPNEFDRGYAGDVCQWVDEEVEQILHEITLADLLECDKPALVIAAARSFRTKCSAFNTGLSRENRSYEKLCVDYRGLNTAWTELNSQCRGLSNRVIARRLDEIQYSMGILQPTFGQAPILRRDSLIRMSAELGQLANQIHVDVHRFDASRYDQRVYKDLCRQCDDLHEAAGRLHNTIVNKPRANYRPQMKKCFKQWTDVRNLIMKCPKQDRRRLAAYRARIEPLMAKLQLVYAD